MSFTDNIINKVGGLALANRFEVIINRSPSSNAVSTTIMAMNATFPKFQFKTKTFADEGFPLRTVPQTFVYEPLDIAFLLDDKYSAKYYFDDWISQIFDFDAGTFGYYQDYVCDININQLDYYDNSLIYRGTYVESWPTEISEVQLSMDGANNYMILPVTFAYRYFKPPQPNQSQSNVTSMGTPVSNTNIV